MAGCTTIFCIVFCVLRPPHLAFLWRLCCVRASVHVDISNDLTSQRACAYTFAVSAPSAPSPFDVVVVVGPVRPVLERMSDELNTCLIVRFVCPGKTNTMALSPLHSLHTTLHSTASKSTRLHTQTYTPHASLAYAGCSSISISISNSTAQPTNAYDMRRLRTQRTNELCAFGLLGPFSSAREQNSRRTSHTHTQHTFERYWNIFAILAYA